MQPNNRHHGHGGDGGREGNRWEDDRRHHSSGRHNNGGYDGGHHPRRNNNYHPGRGVYPGNRHHRDHNDTRHPQNDSFIIDRMGGNDYDRMRGRSGGEGDYANAPKRPASTSPDQRRSDAVLPDEVHSAVEESELKIDDESEEEVANRKAFEDCLRDIDKAVSVWKLAHQIPKDRWNEEVGRFETWDERKKHAMEATIESISKALMSGEITRSNQTQDDSNSDSSDATYPPRASRSKTIGKQLSPTEESFIKALPYCLPLDRGFHVTDKVASKICYCPCGPNVAPWRAAHHVSLDGDCAKYSFQPNWLMDHLKMEGGVFEEREQKKKVKRDLRCMYHYAAAEYLRKLYADWHVDGKLPKRFWLL